MGQLTWANMRTTAIKDEAFTATYLDLLRRHPSWFKVDPKLQQTLLSDAPNQGVDRARHAASLLRSQEAYKVRYIISSSLRELFRTVGEEDCEAGPGCHHHTKSRGWTMGRRHGETF